MSESAEMNYLVGLVVQFHHCVCRKSGCLVHYLDDIVERIDVIMLDLFSFDKIRFVIKIGSCINYKYQFEIMMDAYKWILLMVCLAQTS